MSTTSGSYEPRPNDLPAPFQRMMASGQLVDVLPVGIYFCDRSGRILRHNKAAAELWGRVPGADADERFCGSHRLFHLDGRRLPHDECPMASVLRTGLPARDQTVVIERPDGSRVTVLANVDPVVDDAGELVGAANCFRDISHLQRHQDTLQAQQRRLHALLDALPAAVYTTDASGLITFYNEAAVEMVGRRPEVGQDEWCVSLRLYWPDGRPMPHHECPMALALKQQRAIRGAEALAERPDGRRVPFLAYPTPLFDHTGRLIGAINMLVDISERKDAEQRQQLLVRELNHRVKNTLATVQSIAKQTLHRTDDPAAFVPNFNGRVQALARAHGLLSQSTWRGAGVMELVRDQLLLGGAEDDRIVCCGPSIMLGPQPALHLALALHELGTNARKYGGLSVPDGKLSVTWEVRSRGERDLLLQWHETGGPPVHAPAVRGFGTSLVEQAMQAHGGEACISYGGNGVSCEIRLPLSQTGAERAGASAMKHGAHAPLRDRSGGGQMQPSRILVVEDEALVAMDIGAILKAAGCEVVGPAPSLAKARQLIATERFDAALLDANLAGEPVDEIAAALVQQGVPFAFVTGYGRDGLPPSFASTPMIGKPFDEDELRATLEQLLSQDAKVIRLRQSAG